MTAPLTTAKDNASMASCPTAKYARPTAIVSLARANTKHAVSKKSTETARVIASAAAIGDRCAQSAPDSMASTPVQSVVDTGRVPRRTPAMRTVTCNANATQKAMPPSLPGLGTRADV